MVIEAGESGVSEILDKRGTGWTSFSEIMRLIYLNKANNQGKQLVLDTGKLENVRGSVCMDESYALLTDIAPGCFL